MICPGGPITIFPIAAAFVAIGADTGAAIAFITSWTLLGYARILVWELPFFGGEFVIWRTIISHAAADRRRAAGAALVGLSVRRASEEAANDLLRRRPALGDRARRSALIAASRSRALFRDSIREGAVDCMRLIPRIMLGVIGSGYIAALLPQEVVGRWLGADSGVTGLCIAVLGGAFTPGGPVIGFSIGAAALKGGAGTPQVIAYTIAWALFAVQRLFIWELPVMPERLVWLRVLASLPLPFSRRRGAMLLGRP